ncbi:hypothetical protein SDC9_130246 [bioreactor metagenome]|uniref:Uncharacterized protein n=1 Tax=bioreactor metagenome TaxID=1076179 RepID=A0A645D238_9ZZZZ
MKKIQKQFFLDVLLAFYVGVNPFLAGDSPYPGVIPVIHGRNVALLNFQVVLLVLQARFHGIESGFYPVIQVDHGLVTARSNAREPVSLQNQIIVGIDLSCQGFTVYPGVCGDKLIVVSFSLNIIIQA